MALNEDNEANWVTWNKGRGITARNLTKILKEFNITSNTIRIGVTERAKGYTKDQFSDAFTRYLSFSFQEPLVSSVTTGQLKGSNESSHNYKRDKCEMSRIEKTLNNNNPIDCHVVTDKIPLSTEKKENVTVKGDFLEEEPENKIDENDLSLADDEEAF